MRGCCGRRCGRAATSSASMPTFLHRSADICCWLGCLRERIHLPAMQTACAVILTAAVWLWQGQAGETYFSAMLNNLGHGIFAAFIVCLTLRKCDAYITCLRIACLHLLPNTAPACRQQQAAPTHDPGQLACVCAESSAEEVKARLRRHLSDHAGLLRVCHRPAAAVSRSSVCIPYALPLGASAGG